MNVYQQVNELLKGARNILITAHENPDPDGVGSMLALYLAFKKLGKKSCCYLPDLPKYLNFLPGFHSIKDRVDFFNFDLFFALDYGDFKRLPPWFNLPPRAWVEEKMITIDHHRGDQRGQIKIIKPEFSSTSEIIYDFLQEIKIEIDKPIATCLLTGIVFDTGGFSHLSTSPQIMKVVSALLLKGAPLIKIIRRTLNLRFQPTSQPQTAKIWGQALSRVKLDKKSGLVYSWISWEDLKESKVQPFHLARIPSVISSIFPAKFTLFLVEYEKGKIKGSLRSEPFKRQKVNWLAEALGGGGHSYAAGFKQEGTIEEVLKRVQNLIK